MVMIGKRNSKTTPRTKRVDFILYIFVFIKDFTNCYFITNKKTQFLESFLNSIIVLL